MADINSAVAFTFSLKEPTKEIESNIDNIQHINGPIIEAAVKNATKQSKTEAIQFEYRRPNGPNTKLNRKPLVLIVTDDCEPNNGFILN